MVAKFEKVNKARKVIINKMRMSIDNKQWSENLTFVELLRDTIKKHPISTHPIINLLNSGKVSKESLVKINLEYRFAIAQFFTDALVMAQYQARHLDQRFEPGVKKYPRFLLGLKSFDELLFNDSRLSDLGDPDCSHYPFFEKVLDELGVGSITKKVYIPSKPAKKVRNYLEDNFYDYTSTLALLAVVEITAMLFKGPLYSALNSLASHVVDEGNAGIYPAAEAMDENQENDLWLVLAHACTKEEYISVYELCLKYCELWENFWDMQFENSK